MADTSLINVALLEGLVENLHDAILIFRIPDAAESDPTIIYANKKIELLTGFSPDELIGMSPRILNGPHTDPIRLEEMHQAIIHGESYSTELKNYQKNGSPYWVEIYLEPLLDADGICRHYMSVNRDISRQQNVRNTMLLQASVLDQIQNAVVVLDKDRKVIYWNDSAERLYQYSAKEMMSKRVAKLTHANDFRIAREASISLIEHGYWQGEVRLMRKDGSHFPALVSNRILLSSDNEIIGYVGVVTDISYQKNIQQELEESLHEKEVLLKEIHHRVKNNMQIISSLLFLQSMQSEDKLIQEVLIESQNRVRSMSMVHEKLYRSTNLSRIAFDDYIRELTSDQLSTWVGDDSVIQKNFDLDFVEIDIDKAIPCGLLVNELISNAMKHGFKNQLQGNIWLTLKKKDGTIIITVANDGNPLPSRFSLLHTETLGMQLIDSLTRQLNGAITFETDPHTCFTLQFSE